jgi:hypothetical protein
LPVAFMGLSRHVSGRASKTIFRANGGEKTKFRTPCFPVQFAKFEPS